MNINEKLTKETTQVYEDDIIMQINTTGNIRYFFDSCGNGLEYESKFNRIIKINISDFSTFRWKLNVFIWKLNNDKSEPVILTLDPSRYQGNIYPGIEEHYKMLHALGFRFTGNPDKPRELELML